MLEVVIPSAVPMLVFLGWLIQGIRHSEWNPIHQAFDIIDGMVDRFSTTKDERRFRAAEAAQKARMRDMEKFYNAKTDERRLLAVQWDQEFHTLLRGQTPYRALPGPGEVVQIPGGFRVRRGDAWRLESPETLRVTHTEPVWIPGTGWVNRTHMSNGTAIDKPMGQDIIYPRSGF